MAASSRAAAPAASATGIETVATPSGRGPAMYARIPIVVGIEVASARERVKGDALVADLGVEFLCKGRATPPPLVGTCHSESNHFGTMFECFVTAMIMK